MSKAYSPEFLAYCQAHGRGPEAQLAHDEEAFSGGVMCGFLDWAGQALTEFKRVHPEAFAGFRIVDQRAKLVFLQHYATGSTQ